MHTGAMDQQQRPPRLTVACTWCDGYGHRIVPTATGNGGTLNVPRECQHCKGSGKRRGFHPPV